MTKFYLAGNNLQIALRFWGSFRLRFLRGKGSAGKFCQGAFDEHDLVEVFGVVVYEGLDKVTEGGFLSVFKVGGACPDARGEWLEVGEGLGASGCESRKKIVEGEAEIVGGGVREEAGDGGGGFFRDAMKAGEGTSFDGEEVMKNVGGGPLIWRNARKPYKGGKVA